MSADELHACANCGDEVEVGLSSRDWCDGCEETAYELDFPEVETARAVDVGALQVFAYKHTQLRTVVISARRWAVAADICGFLELKDVAVSLRRIDDEDKLTIRRSDTRYSALGIWNLFAPQVQSVSLVSEDGATDLVLESRKPDARRFRRFLTHTVWPAVRDTGSYTAVAQTREERLALAVIDAQQMLAEKDEQIEAVTNEKKCLEAAIERDAPLVAKAEAHSGSDSAIHRQAFAREVQHWAQKQGVDIKHSEVMRFLSHIGLFIRGDRTDTGHATADAQRRGLAYTHKDIAKNGHPYAVGRLTAAGQDYAWKRITRYVGEHGNLRLPRELRRGDPA